MVHRYTEHGLAVTVVLPGKRALPLEQFSWTAGQANSGAQLAAVVRGLRALVPCRGYPVKATVSATSGSMQVDARVGTHGHDTGDRVHCDACAGICSVGDTCDPCKRAWYNQQRRADAPTAATADAIDPSSHRPNSSLSHGQVVARYSALRQQKRATDLHVQRLIDRLHQYEQDAGTASVEVNDDNLLEVLFVTRGGAYRPRSSQCPTDAPPPSPFSFRRAPLPGGPLAQKLLDVIDGLRRQEPPPAPARRSGSHHGADQQRAARPRQPLASSVRARMRRAMWACGRAGHVSTRGVNVGAHGSWRSRCCARCRPPPPPFRTTTTAQQAVEHGDAHLAAEPGGLPRALCRPGHAEPAHAAARQGVAPDRTWVACGDREGHGVRGALADVAHARSAGRMLSHILAGTHARTARRRDSALLVPAHGCDPSKLSGGLVFDEMGLQEGLVWNQTTNGLDGFMTPAFVTAEAAARSVSTRLPSSAGAAVRAPLTHARCTACFASWLGTDTPRE